MTILPPSIIIASVAILVISALLLPLGLFLKKFIRQRSKLNYLDLDSKYFEMYGSAQYFREAKQRSLSYIEEWSTPEFVDYRSRVVVDDVNHSMDNSLLYLLNFAEKVSVAVFNNLADDDILRRSLIRDFDVMFTKNIRSIQKVRRDQENPYLFVNFEMLLERWLSPIRER